MPKRTRLLRLVHEVEKGQRSAERPVVEVNLTVGSLATPARRGVFFKANIQAKQREESWGK